ncbi:uncharacterized protein LOC122847868, partial [Aphidius gifuensis]|uniref:uncharacterized protein LOC122847868 n=1 Tax=Aphidius gifuensis TaxID=684658 RepID=UPI001CDD581A
MTMSLSEFIALFGSFNDAEEFANASFLFVTHICVYGLLIINCTHIKLLKYRISTINKYISDTLILSLYDTQWTSLSINGKKSLIIMMIHSRKLIQYTCGYIVTLSLDAFTSILKLSYSIFN